MKEENKGYTLQCGECCSYYNLDPDIIRNYRGCGDVFVAIDLSLDKVIGIEYIVHAKDCASQIDVMDDEQPYPCDCDPINTEAACEFAKNYKNVSIGVAMLSCWQAVLL